MPPLHIHFFVITSCKDEFLEKGTGKNCQSELFDKQNAFHVIIKLDQRIILMLLSSTTGRAKGIRFLCFPSDCLFHSSIMGCLFRCSFIFHFTPLHECSYAVM